MEIRIRAVAETVIALMILFAVGMWAKTEIDGGNVRLCEMQLRKTEQGMGADERTKDAAEPKKVALTFDDGPYPKLTMQLLDGLRERGAKASFFVLGKAAESNPTVIQTMYEDGHLIGNHTYHHVQLTRVGDETFCKEIQDTNEVIYKITGETPQFIRPPYGSWNKKIEEKLNMLPVLWDVDPLDWCNGDAACICQKVVTKVEENDIILLHDCYPSSVTAALMIVDQLQEQGYEFVTVDEIIME